MTATQLRIFQVLKYALYAFLTLNVYIFFVDEYGAAQVQFGDGVPLAQMREAYAATIDTAAWVVLLLMFELETFLLHDHHFTKPVVLTLQGFRAASYAIIVWAFVGYVDNLVFFDNVAPLANIESLCSLSGDWSYAPSLDEFTTITASNCNSLSSATSFLQVQNLNVVVDPQDLDDIRGLAWVDVINAAVWLLVVLVLEIDVRLQEKNRFEGAALRISYVVKWILYSTLILALVFWAFRGDFVDVWDAFLWLVAFFFIELNVVEWRKEVRAVS